MIGRDTLAPVRVTSMLLGLLLAGCSFEHGRLPLLTDAPMPDIPDVPRDTDGDGIIDSDDNCPIVGNTDQRDHENDGRGDVCDRCPHVPNAADPDGDGDGVGDECDPRPSTAGDVRVLWEGFYDTSAISTWTLMGNWTVASGFVQQASGTGETSLALPTMFQRPYVETAFRVDSLGGASALIGMCSSISATQYYCCLMRNSGPVLNAVSSGAVSENQSTAWPGLFNAGERVMLTENESTTHECVAKQGSTNTARSTALGATAGKLQLYMRDATASYDYLFLVEIGQ